MVAGVDTCRVRSGFGRREMRERAAARAGPSSPPKRLHPWILLRSLVLGFLLVVLTPAAFAQPATSDRDSSREAWVALFNGRNLEGWIPKIRGHAPGENYADTFRVVDGLLTVSYSRYSEFAEQFGHLFYKDPFSHYRLRVEYRFIGEQAANAPSWAIRNSGVMVHSQSPWTMPDDQDFPISVEVQFLGGLSDGMPRPTGNVCTPGTHIVYRGVLTETHCINSSSPTLDGDQWVRSETLVLGSERIVHYINGQQVIEYGGIVTGGGVVSGHRPEFAIEGRPLGAGYVSLQSEGHPVQFRRVELLNLKGCTDQRATNYKRYYVQAANETCRY